MIERIRVLIFIQVNRFCIICISSSLLNSKIMERLIDKSTDIEYDDEIIRILFLLVLS
jgi:hypothetical protein